MTPLESAQARINARKPRRSTGCGIDTYITCACLLALVAALSIVFGASDETDPPVVVVQR